MEKWLYYNNTSLEFNGLKIEPSLPPVGVRTLRFKFSDPSFNPTTAPSLLSEKWSWSLVEAEEGLWDLVMTLSDLEESERLFYGVFSEMNYNGNGSMGNVKAEIVDGDLTGIEYCSSMFSMCDSLTKVTIRGTGSVIYMQNMFEGCFGLASVSLDDTSSVMDMSYMFMGCGNLTSMPSFDTSHVEFMNQMFQSCGLTEIKSGNDFRTDRATDVNYMFSFCENVTSGAYDLYVQLSTQASPPSSHRGCFEECGANTTTGAAELAQIPESWGGTAT